MSEIPKQRQKILKVGHSLKLITYEKKSFYVNRFIEYEFSIQ